MVVRLISGGQTGVDRGALDAAISLEVVHGGWCPSGRRAEDGRIPTRYQLTEADVVDYEVRTRRNVQDSDATLILTRGAFDGGTKLTAEIANQVGKPSLRIELTEELGPAARRLRAWLLEHEIRTLNVAGPRESNAPGIQLATRGFLARALAVPETIDAAVALLLWELSPEEQHQLAETADQEMTGAALELRNYVRDCYRIDRLAQTFDDHPDSVSTRIVRGAQQVLRDR